MKLTFTILMILFSLNAWGATYTVCSSGCDETTIQAVFDNNDLSPGDIVEIRADTVGGTATFRERVDWGSNDVGISGNHVTLQGRTGDDIIINCSDIITTFSGPDGNGEYTKAGITTEPLMVLSDDVVLMEGTITTLGAAEWAWNADTLYLGFDPTSNTIEAHQRYGLVITGRSFITIKNLSVVNGRFLVYADSSGSTNDVIVDGVTMKNAALGGAYFAANETAPDWQENITIKNSTFQDIGYWGFSGATSLRFYNRTRNITIENNIFQGNGSTLGVDGIQIQAVGVNTYGYTINGNTFSGFEENAIDLKGGTPPDSSYSEIYDNDISDIDLGDIHIHYGAQQWKIYNNYFHDSKAAISFVWHDTATELQGYIQIYGNVFDTYTNTLLMDGTAVASGNNTFIGNTCYNIGASEASNYSIDIATDTYTIKNNIFYDLSIGLGASSPVMRFRTGVDMSSIDLDYNLVKLYSGNGYINEVDVGVHSMAATEANGIQSDPLFANAAGNNFRLKAGSDAIGAGAKLTIHVAGWKSFYKDNRLCGEGPDIGADEYCKSASVVIPPRFSGGSKTASWYTP